MAQRVKLVNARILRLSLCAFGKHGFQVVPLNQRVNNEPLLLAFVKHFLDNTGSRRAPCGKRCNAHAHQGTIGNGRVIFTQCENVVLHAIIKRHDHTKRLHHIVATHHRLMRAIDNAHHASSRAFLA